MPSTEYFGVTMSSVGALTTTFSPSPACATNTADNWLSDHNGDGLGAFNPHCRETSLASSCVPDADTLNDLQDKAKEGFKGQGWLVYWSPGLHCPHGWTTAGVAASKSGSDSISTSGIFASDDEARGGDSGITAAAGLPPSDIFTAVLEPEETFVWCCPSGHNLDAFGVCSSRIGSFDSEKYDYITAFCEATGDGSPLVTVTSFDGTTWDPPLLSQVSRRPLGKPSEVPLTASDAFVPEKLDVVHYAGAIAMYHKQEDVDKDKDEGGGDDDDDDAGTSLPALGLAGTASIVFGFLAAVAML